MLCKSKLNCSLLLFQRKEFVKYAKVFPLSETLDFKVPSKWYRRTVGLAEIACGMAMAFVPSRKYQNILHLLFRWTNGITSVFIFVQYVSVLSSLFQMCVIKNSFPSLTARDY